MTSIKEIRNHSKSYYEPKREISFEFGDKTLRVFSNHWQVDLFFPIKKFLWWEYFDVPVDSDGKDVPVFLVKNIREWLEECYLHSTVGYVVNGEEI